MEGEHTEMMKLIHLLEGCLLLSTAVSGRAVSLGNTDIPCLRSCFEI